MQESHKNISLSPPIVYKMTKEWSNSSTDAQMRATTEGQTVQKILMSCHPTLFDRVQ